VILGILISFYCFEQMYNSDIIYRKNQCIGWRMKWLNYHHLYYFLQIAEHGSISKAAEALRTGQPGLSSQLKELEETIGVLFDRRNRGLHLNDRGKIVLKYAKEIFSKGNELLSVLERGELAPKRTLVAGVQEGVPKAIIAQTLMLIRKQTGVNLKVIEDDPLDLVEGLGSGKLDFIVVDQELAHAGSTIFYKSIGSEKLGIWGSEGFLKFQKNFPKSLSTAPFIVSPLGHPLRQDIEHFFLSQELQLNIIAEAPDTALIKELAVEGLGLVTLGEKTVKSWVRSHRLFKIGQLPMTQKYWLGLAKRTLKDPLVDQIIKEFQAKDI